MNNIKRREFLKTIGAGTLLLTLPKFLTSCASETKRPNIMFCIADDWGWPHAGVYGDQVIKTLMDHLNIFGDVNYRLQDRPCSYAV